MVAAVAPATDGDFSGMHDLLEEPLGAKPMADPVAGEVLKPGDSAPSLVLDAATRDGVISIDDFRGRQPVLIGLFRGLHCPFCRRHLAAQVVIDRELREKGVESVAVVSTPIERARLFFRYHPIPDLVAAADPQRATHRAFGLRNLDLAAETGAISRGFVMAVSAGLNVWDGYKMADVDWQVAREASGQLFGQFLIDRDGIIRWAFAEAPEEGRPLTSRPAPAELIEAATRLAA
jgi:peroxiredoxin